MQWERVSRPGDGADCGDLKASGKTKTAYSIAASAQKDHGMTVGYVNGENQFFGDFAVAQGVNLKDLKVINGNVIEQVAEAIEGFMPYIDLFIIDSTSSLQAASSKESGIDSERPMMDAKAWARSTQFLNAAHDSTRNTIIFIDQARVGKTAHGMPGGEQASGGYALDHYSTLTAKFTAGKWLYRDGDYLTDKDAPTTTVSGQKEPAGREMKVRIEKSRVGAPFRTATLWFDFSIGDYESEFEYLKWGKHLGLIEGGIAGRYSIGSEKLHGQAKVKQYIRENLDLQQEIKEKVLASA